MGHGLAAGGGGLAVDEDLPAALRSGIELALGVQQAVVANYVQRLRRARFEATPAAVVSTLERRYLAVVTGTGAAAGGAAAVPGVGTGLALALGAGETAVFLETTALFTLAVAEVHDVRIEDAERRRALMLAIVLGDGGAMLVEKVTGRTGEHWGKLLTDVVPISSVNALNKTLCTWFLTRYGRNYGFRALGRIAPFGIGAGIGALGNHAFGRMVIRASRRAFGPAPASFADLTIVDSPAQTPALARISGTLGPVVVPTAGHVALDDPETTSAGPALAEPQSVPAEAAVSQQAEAPVTGKYRPLYDYLAAPGADHIKLSFSEVSAVVTGGLPRSASTARSWWSNSASNRQAKAWLAAGFEVAKVDLQSRTVWFEKRS